MPGEISDRFHKAIESIDAANSADPNVAIHDGQPFPHELLYAQWLTGWVLRLKPDASESLRLAARAQHICRWLVPRDTYPKTREGYLKWRGGLKTLHAQKAGEILGEAGYSEPEVRRIQELILKKLFPRDEEARVLEDALCLVFLEKQFGSLAAKTSDEKMINALKKAWKKMTPAARAVALELCYTDREKTLLTTALSSAEA